MLKRGCKLIVVACNTATTNAIVFLRKQFDVPFVGIEPAIKPAAENTTTGVVGILATRGTLKSEFFHSKLSSYKNLKIVNQIGYGLVKLIEKGQLNDLQTKSLLFTYLDPMLEKGIDHLVLGCSHYPFLKGLIFEILDEIRYPKKINIIDSGQAVAKQIQHVLRINGLSNTSQMSFPNYQFLTNSDTLNVVNLLIDRRYVRKKSTFSVLKADF